MKKIILLATLFGALSMVYADSKTSHSKATKTTETPSPKTSSQNSKSRNCKTEEDKAKGCVVRYENKYYGTVELTKYKDGKKNGVQKYKRYGTLERETSYHDDKKDGIEKIYYGNGKLKSEISYKHGKRHGALKSYDYDEKVIFTATFKDNKITNAKCHNGKTLTRVHLNAINRGEEISCDSNR
ncbi:hypothetical protein CQA53_03870 [Helicobacter didelphidarum]|uniref:Toxin-antitoxin system YwqK family antitoxin n=1 Tax=Helicobacter didelphidarum TaxID=2040648 RepID=A0A3D8IM64_9HELI|nr:hypothetical protein [Helicobacter didelphidarum]RDU66367.1 hypothetical protein CQA53_03870 [Helicobacter didelphidarum]